MQRRNKISLGFKKLIFSLLSLSVLVQPLVAQAQLVVTDPASGVMGSIVYMQYDVAKETVKAAKDAAKETLLKALASAAAVAFKNGITYFAKKIAEDTAKWVASGDTGQKPLFFSEGWGTYLQDVGEQAVAESVTSFAKVAGLGNICVSPEVAIDILLPAIDVGVRRPRCSLDQLKKAWDVTDPKFLENFTLSFSTGQNDLGVTVDFLNNIDRLQKKKEEAAKNERLSQAAKDVKGAINDVIETPGYIVSETFKQAGADTDSAIYQYTGQPLADAVSTFTKTLLSQYLRKLQSGFFTLADVVNQRDALGQARNSLLDPNATGLGGAQNAQAQFTNVFRPDVKQSSKYDIVGEFVSCPTEVKYAGLYNCVIDDAFAQALQPTGEESFLSVREAVKRGLLHGDWAFGFTNPGDGTEPSYLNGYAYSNMKKLRRMSIIPVGWELAALKVRQIGERTTLQKVLDGFTTPQSPFFKMVDPDWVLKVPDLRCSAYAPGQIVVADSGKRANTCVDVQDCVVTGKDGQCQTWGYCTNAKRSWSFPAEKCSEVFATCEQFSEEGVSDNLWLSNTVEYQGCSAQTAGCLWYALAKSASGEWKVDDRVFLNNQAQACQQNEAGCRSYIRMIRGSNLLRNSSFEDDGGHDYVLGGGDSLADNNIPDGWSAKAVSVQLDDTLANNGTKAVALKMLGTAGQCQPGLQYTAPVGSFEVGQQYTLSGQIRTDATNSRSVLLAFQGNTFTVEDVGRDWKAFSFQFIMPATSAAYTLTLGANNGTCSDLATTNSVFYDALQLEKAPQASPYSNYGQSNLVNLKAAPACTFEDVGCSVYKSATPGAVGSVTGVATGSNLCPAECEGYDTFEQQSTDIEPTRFANFIPKTARQCSAENVGCQEYTNLDTVAKGGEGLEYYSEIRFCSQPQPQCATYYAWEGSDQSGYQLMTYSLLASNTDGSGPAKTTDGSVTCSPFDKNCRELIAASGARAMRNMTKTITCSEACVPLRAGPNTVTQTECQAKLGTWDTASQRCVYQVLPSDSRVCPAQFNGCREYIGNTGRNVAIVFDEQFEDGDSAGWSNGTLSTESTVVGGHSMKLGTANSTISITSEVLAPNATVGKGYELELSAKASIPDQLTVSVYLGNAKGPATKLGGFTTGTRSWQQYKVGPHVLADNTTLPVKLFIEVSGSTSRNEVVSLFVDNIQLRQVKNSEYLVKDSWKTPNTCETNPPLANGSAGRSMLGCKAYTVQGQTTGNKTYLTGFARLCSEEKIGCEAVIDTQNSRAPYREIYLQADAAERVVPEDRVRYVVNRKEFACPQEAVGCTELGRPEFGQDGKIESFTPVYLVNNPDTYTQTLCKGEGLFCKRFTTSSGSIAYAKHPGKQQCQYREVPGSFPTRFAWFKIGDSEEDPQECADAKKNSFVLQCPAEEVSCTQYVEPITKEAYFYKKNTLSDTSANCNGVVNWKEGCVLFDDASLLSKTFKSGDKIDVVGAPEACQTGDVNCNTNTLLRVNLDRTCSQWITGVSTSRFYDRTLGQYRVSSYSLGRCLQADPLNPALCRIWDNSIDKPALTAATYTEREVSWAGQDYTGFSIPNEFPIETLRQRSVGYDDDGNPTGFRLTRLSDPIGSCQSNLDCQNSFGPGRVCRLALDPVSAQYSGRCYIEDGVNGQGQSLAQECRAYPEEGSPFPSRLAIFAPPNDPNNPGQIITKDQIFKDANIGEDGENVECSYHKVTYNSLPRYYGLQSTPPTTIKVNGQDNKFVRKDTFIGWQGYCLERDPSRLINGSQNETACLTWYPVDLVEGAIDFNNTTLKSGYIAPNDRDSYCIESMIAEYRTFAQFCDYCPVGYKPIAGNAVSKSATCRSGDTGTLRQGIDPSNPLVYTLIGNFVALGLENTNVKHKVLCEPVDGQGWYPYDGSLSFGYNSYTEKLGVMCNKIARIQGPDGSNRAATTSILGKTLPGHKQVTVRDLGWGPDQANAPYGAASTLVSRLEDLKEPLIIRDPYTFVADCSECEREDLQPYGKCKDDDPLKKDKFCALTPNAGSPYALYSPSQVSDINDVNVLIRKDNALPKDKPQPYPLKSENYKEGIDRLSDLFAKSYGVWAWQGLKSVCVGTCQGGLSNGESCASDAQCGEVNPEYVYTCKGDPVNKKVGTCIGGISAGKDCVTTTDCAYQDTGTVHQCEMVTGPNQNPNSPEYVCKDGPFAGKPCGDIDDCSERNATGVCSYEARCQARDSAGNVVQGVNSGKLCKTSQECGAPGVCAVNRCSTDKPDAPTAICSGKKAGDSCGTSNTAAIAQYQRLTASNPAAGWDLVTSNPAKAKEPVMRPAVADPTSPNGFNEGAITGFSVNNNVGGIIQGTDGRAPVTVAFYAYNDNGEQMPLRLLMVDWDDNSDPAESRGAFKNHKHVCRKFCQSSKDCVGTAEQCKFSGLSCSQNEDCRSDLDPKATCEPFNFGDADDSCLGDTEAGNGFFTFSYTYTCEGPASAGWNATSKTCIFKPSVLVRDNWGATTRTSFPGSVVVNLAPQP